MPDVLVVNASPLIFLGNAGRIDLLRATGAGRIIVPEPVFDEVIAGGHADAAAKAISEAAWLEKGRPSDVPASVIAWDLGAGESSVIAMALQLPGAYAVIDDLSGRKCGLAFGIGVIGTLGVIVAAHRRGALTDPRAALLELRSAGMWLSGGHRARLANRWNRAVVGERIGLRALELSRGQRDCERDTARRRDPTRLTTCSFNAAPTVT